MGSALKTLGLGSIGKLALNSFYGKFGQKSNMKKTVYITEYEKLYNLLTDRTRKIKDFHMLDVAMVAVEYVQNANVIETNTKTNVVVASFCMSYA